MNTVINHFHQPIVLENGTLMGAAGTEGSTRNDVELSERDRTRYVRPNMLVVIEAASTEALSGNTPAPDLKKKENK